MRTGRRGGRGAGVVEAHVSLRARSAKRSLFSDVENPRVPYSRTRRPGSRGPETLTPSLTLRKVDTDSVNALCQVRG